MTQPPTQPPTPQQPQAPPPGGPPPLQQQPGGPPPVQYGGAGAGTPRASFGQRFLAFLLDFIMLAIVGNLLGALFGADLGAYSPTVSLINTLLGIAYFTYFEGSDSGQTVGKKVLNIRVVDLTTNGPLGYGKAALRYVGKILSSIPCFLGFFWMLWDTEKQTWHDKIATTTVVPTSAFPVTKWP